MVDIRDLTGSGWDNTELNVKEAAVKIANNHFKAGWMIGFCVGALLTLLVLFVVVSLRRG